MRSPRTAMKSSPCSLQLEKAQAQQQRPNAAKNKQINKSIKKKEVSIMYTYKIPIYMCVFFPVMTFEYSVSIRLPVDFSMYSYFKFIILIMYTNTIIQPM